MTPFAYTKQAALHLESKNLNVSSL